MEKKLIYTKPSHFSKYIIEKIIRQKLWCKTGKFLMAEEYYRWIKCLKLKVHKFKVETTKIYLTWN